MTQLDLFPEDAKITHDEGLPNLPSSWEWTILDCVSDTAHDRRNPQAYSDLPFIGMADVESATNRIIQTTLSSEMKSNAEYFESGDVLYGRLRPYLNKVVRPEFNGLASAEFIVFRQHQFLDNKYLLYFLSSWDFVSFASHLNEGDRPRVSFDQLKTYPFPLAPLNEQIRIVEAIETLFTRLDAGVEALKRLQKNLERYKASVLKAACEGNLVPQNPDDEPASELLKRILTERRTKWEAEELARYKAKGQRPPKGWQNKYQEPTQPDAAGLPELPDGWVWAKLDALAEVRGGVTKGRDLNGIKTVTIPYLRVANVQDGFLDLEVMKEIIIKETELDKYRLEMGDILFNEGGDRDKLGRGAIWRDELDYCAHQNHVYSARRYSDEIASEWIDIARRLEYARDYFWREASQSVNLASINMTNLKGLPIPIPSAQKQQEILDAVDEHSTMVNAIQKQIEQSLLRSERLRQAILKEAFAGRLVPQDPSDEPASELLKRVKAEKGKR